MAKLQAKEIAKTSVDAFCGAGTARSTAFTTDFIGSAAQAATREEGPTAARRRPLDAAGGRAPKTRSSSPFKLISLPIAVISDIDCKTAIVVIVIAPDAI